MAFYMRIGNAQVTGGLWITATLTGVSTGLFGCARTPLCFCSQVLFWSAATFTAWFSASPVLQLLPAQLGLFACLLTSLFPTFKHSGAFRAFLQHSPIYSQGRDTFTSAIFTMYSYWALRTLVTGHTQFNFVIITGCFFCFESVSKTCVG